ncbi:BrnT family toxin [Bradyrhizobium sp. SZCCHNPS10061]|nr:BrnT family toxin [Bradyrhizobium sp. SZCCHNPS10061]
MKITFDPAKRDATLTHRGLDFADAARVFEGDHATWLDDRFDYGEVRQITAGWLGDRMVVFVWTQRGNARHVISMRHCHDKEERKIRRRFGL